jgi:hypothetical protein
MTFKEELKKLGASKCALDWAENKTLEEAWNTCDNPYWMLWYAERKVKEKRKIFLCYAKFIESTIHLINNKNSEKVLDLSLRYINGEDVEKLDVISGYASYVMYYSPRKRTCDIIRSVIKIEDLQCLVD